MNSDSVTYWKNEACSPVQEKILELYKTIADIAVRNHVRTFAIGGTAIGAVRHRGFIPWDDDLDIAVPVEDLVEFIEALNDELPDKYELIDARISPIYISPMLKVHDTTTTMVEKQFVRYPERYTGVWVDIMPMGGIPSGFFARASYLREIKRCAVNDAAMRLPADYPMSTRIKLQKFLFSKRYSSAEEYAYFSAWQNRISRLRLSGAKFTGYTWSTPSKYWLPKLCASTLARRRMFFVKGSYALEDLIFPGSWFEESIDFPFCDTTISLPVGWHEYLTYQFGDYMQLPPREQRYTHNGFIDLAHSYTEYRDGHLAIPADFLESGGEA